MAQGGLLVIDNVEIPTVNVLKKFLKADAMYHYLGQKGTTAFFERTTAPLAPDPEGEGWGAQKFNRKYMRIDYRLKFEIKRFIGDKATIWIRKRIIHR